MGRGEGDGVRSKVIPPRIVGRKPESYPGLTMMRRAIISTVGNVQTPQMRKGTRRSAVSVARTARLRAAWCAAKEV